MVLQALCFVCLASQSSALDKKVTCEIVRAPLNDVLVQLGKQAGVPISLSVVNRDFSSTVLVKDRPLRQVLDALASVHGLSVDATASSITLRGTSARAQQDRYVRDEDALLMREALARFSALAELTRRPYDPNPVGAEAKEGEMETPAAWAKRRIHKWPYYMAGMWYGIASRYNPTMPGRLNFFKPLVTVGFWASQPGSKAELEESNAWVDENSAQLVGRQVQFYISPITYDIRLAGVEPFWPAEPSPRFPYAFSTPPPSLRATPFAKETLAWVTPADKLDTEELKKRVKEAETPESEGWFGGKTSLATVLRSFHRQTGIDVVSDAYRISIRTSPSEVAGKTGQEWIKNLAEKEACFTRYEPGMLMVRHPAFWRLEQTEPTDTSLKWLEAIAAKGRPKIPEYAEFMAANYFEMQMRFDSVTTCLTRFDPRPIHESGPALLVVGKVPKGEKSAFLSGVSYPIEIITEGGVRPRESMGAFVTARLAPVYGATASGVCKLLLRQGPARQSYPMLMGYDKLVHPAATDIFRYITLSMSQDQLSGEFRMGFGAGDNIVYKLDASKAP